MATPSEISELARCRAVFTPGHPARTGTVAFQRTDGAAPQSIATGSVETLAVALPDGDGIDLVEVPGVVVPVQEALPVLTRARADAHAHPAVAFWGAAAVLALQSVARGLLPPGLSPSDNDAWRVGPLSTEDVDRVRRLAAAMPPEAHAVPQDARVPLRLPEPERLLRGFLDAVAAALPRGDARDGRPRLRRAATSHTSRAARLGHRGGGGSRRRCAALPADRGDRP